MRKNTKKVWFRSFGGVCQSYVGENIPYNLLRDSLNYEINQQNELEPSRGVIQLAPSVPDGGKILTIYPANFDGDLKELVATDKNVYEHLNGSYIKIFEFDNLGKIEFAIFNVSTNPVVVMGNGIDAMKAWDGGNIIDLPEEAPIGKPFSFKNYLTVYDIYRQPGKVQFAAESGSYDKWLRDGIEIYLESVGNVNKIFEFSNGLIIFSNNGSRTDFFNGDPYFGGDVINLSSEIGCVAPSTVSDCAGTLVWLSKGGIEYWTGGGRFPTNRLSNPYYQVGEKPKSNIQKDIDLLDASEKDVACGAYYPEKNSYIFSSKLLYDKTSVGRSWVFNFNSMGWFPRGLGLTSMANVANSDSTSKIHCSGNDGDLLLWGGSSSPTDKGVEFEFWAKMPDLDMGMPDNSKFFRSYTIGCRGKGIRTFEVENNPEFGLVETTVTDINCDVVGDGFILGIGILGVDRLGSSEKNRYMERREPLAIRAKHISPIFWGNSKNHDVTISAFAIEYREDTQRHLIVEGIPAPVVEVQLNNPYRANTVVNIQPTATGGFGKITWSAKELPPQLTIDPSTGLISGVFENNTSEEQGYRSVVIATDSNGNSGCKRITLMVDAIPPYASGYVALANLLGTPTAIGEGADGRVYIPTIDSGGILRIYKSTDPNTDIKDTTSFSLIYTSSPMGSGIDVISNGGNTYVPTTDFKIIKIDAVGNITTRSYPINPVPYPKYRDYYTSISASSFSMKSETEWAVVCNGSAGSTSGYFGQYVTFVAITDDDAITWRSLILSSQVAVYNGLFSLFSIKYDENTPNGNKANYFLTGSTPHASSASSYVNYRHTYIVGEDTNIEAPITFYSNTYSASPIESKELNGKHLFTAGTHLFIQNSMIAEIDADNVSVSKIGNVPTSIPYISGNLSVYSSNNMDALANLFTNHYQSPHAWFQYSTDGGLNWNEISTYDFDSCVDGYQIFMTGNSQIIITANGVSNNVFLVAK